MSLKLVNIPSSLVHIGNSIRFLANASGENSVMVSLSVKEKIVFTSSYMPYENKIEFDISEVLASFVSSSIITEINQILIPVSDFTVQYKIVLEGTETIEFEGTAICGGISKAAFRELASKSLDIFSYRLNNSTRQFLMTTRTNSRHIVIRETEITPLLFLHPGTSLSFVSDRGRVIISPAQAVGTIYGLNISYIRKLFYNSYQEIAAYFSILVNDSYVFDISFTPGALSEERYTLLFRNSLGCYESLEVVGKAEFTHELEEDSNFSVFDSAVNGYITHNERLTRNQVIKVETGYKKVEELLFIQDLLQSDDIYFCDKDNKVKVHVTAENYSTHKINHEPKSISLTVELAEEENFYSPTIDYSAPEIGFGEWILEEGFINNWGFIYNDKLIND